MRLEHAPASMPDLIAIIKDHVRENIGAKEDVTAKELIELLEMAWCAAERWRLERYELNALEDENLLGGADGFSGFV